MKTIQKIFIILFLLIISIGAIQAQTITPEKRQQIIKDLNDPDPFAQSGAIYDVAKYDITEAIPIIEQKIWNDKFPHLYSSLSTLEKLKAPHLYSIAHALIDSAETIAQRTKSNLYDPLETKVLATEYLYKFNDFSTTQYVFDYLRDTSKVLIGGIFTVLKHAAKDVPAYADSAKIELLYLARYAKLNLDRWAAINDLAELYGQEMFPEVVYMFVNDVNASNRYSALKILFNLNYPGLQSLLQDRLSKEAEWVYRIYIADSLLSRFGAPSDYQFVAAYQAVAPNPTEKSLIGQALEAFKPPIPSSSAPVLNLLDSLISIKHQTAVYTWLGDENFVNELDNDLENARKHLDRSDSVSCRKEVERFQDKINKKYQKTVDEEKKNKPQDKRFVSDKGWKFLYYNAQYIIDRLPILKKSK